MKAYIEKKYNLNEKEQVEKLETLDTADGGFESLDDRVGYLQVLFEEETTIEWDDKDYIDSYFEMILQNLILSKGGRI